MNPSDPTQISQDPLHPGQSFRGFEILEVLEGHSLGILSVAFHPKAQVVATGCADTEVRLWDLQAGKRPRVFTEPTANSSRPEARTNRCGCGR